MDSKKVFLVYSPEFAEFMEYIDAIFDDYDDAVAFTKRFKENSEFEISERILNPIYETSKDQSPYYVRFLRGESEPIDACLVDLPRIIEAAKVNEIVLERYSENDESFNFSQYLFATNLDEAIAQVRENRDEFIASKQLENNG